MSNFVGITDPVCLDLPELEQGEGDLFASFRLEDGGVRGSRPPFMLSVSLAAALHGLLGFLALTMVMGAGVPSPVIGIALLPAMMSGPGPASGPSLAKRSSSEAAPSAEVRTKPAAAAKVDPKPVSSETVIKKNAAPVARAARRPEPAKRVKAEVAHVPSVAEEAADSDPPRRSEKTGTAGSGVQVRPSGAVAHVDPHASGTTGIAGGGGNAADGPVGATFGDADGPRFVQRVTPRYPELARRRGREGLVLLRLVIGPDGELRDARIVEGGGHGFGEAALAAVRASVYAPATRNGRGVECAALLPIRFALKGS